MKKAIKKDLKMWQYICYLSVIILILCGITFLLSSCTEEMIATADNTSQDSGKMVEVKFAMNNSTNGDADYKVKVMEPGVSYVLRVSFKKGAIWAGSNIYRDGNKLTFEPADG